MKGKYKFLHTHLRLFFFLIFPLVLAVNFILVTCAEHHIRLRSASVSVSLARTFSRCLYISCRSRWLQPTFHSQHSQGLLESSEVRLSTDSNSTRLPRARSLVLFPNTARSGSLNQNFTSKRFAFSSVRFVSIRPITCQSSRRLESYDSSARFAPLNPLDAYC